MADSGETPSEPLFRSNKRRKVFRRRTDTDDDAIDAAPVPTTTTAEDGDEEAVGVARVRRTVVKKHGVAFSSSRPAQPQDAEASDEMAMVIHPDREQAMPGVDRFVKPTGKLVVEDDRHLTAFIDSKLAEMRSATPNAATQASEDLSRDTQQKQDGSGNASPDQVVLPTAGRGQSRRHQPKMKRPPKPRDPNDIARESLVDQIMRESAVPLYDRSASGTPFAAKTSGTSQEDLDHEAAAAEAFKRQFLTDMEERIKRKPPVAQPFSKVAQAKGTDRTSHGPKLGGSRKQRERYKASGAEEGGEAAKLLLQKK